jgi:hypothetical protein
MWRRILPGITALLVSGSGCVMVNPGDVRVASPAPSSVGHPKATPEPMTAYGPELQRVMAQQHKVLKEFRKGHISKVADEAGKWTEQVRVLDGYAGASHDPARFQGYCQQLLVQTQAVRDAAVREDSLRCDQALRACDPILNNFSRDFPTSAIAPPAAPRPARPASSPPPVP